MKKAITSFFALLLAAVTLLALPISAMAITYSGGYGGVNYVATVNGSSSNIITTISVDSSSVLYITTTAYYRSVLTNGHVDTYKGPKKNATYLNGSYSYSDVLSVSGYFTSCTYNTTMNGYYVVSNESLSF